MGSALYYLKADGCTIETFERVKKFICEGIEAEQYWQENRENDENKAERFWREFDCLFPMIKKYLISIHLFGKDYNNDLAGHLDFGDDPKNVEGSLIFDEDYTDEDNVIWGNIRYSAYVWHFAEWDGFVNFLESEFKLKNARWLSEEDMDPFDLL